VANRTAAAALLWWYSFVSPIPCAATLAAAGIVPGSVSAVASEQETLIFCQTFEPL
jgi:hypothetical protein